MKHRRSTDALVDGSASYNRVSVALRSSVGLHGLASRNADILEIGMGSYKYPLHVGIGNLPAFPLIPQVSGDVLYHL